MIYRFNAIPIKSQWQFFFFCRNKSILKSMYILKGLWMVTVVLKRKNKVEYLSLPDFKKLWSYGNQNRMALIWSRIYKPMKKNKEPNNKTSSMVKCFSTKMQGKGQFLQQIVLGKLDIYIEKNHVGPSPYIILKTLVMMCQRPKCERWNRKILKKIASV
jgi:hypothetical protein